MSVYRQKNDIESTKKLPRAKRRQLLREAIKADREAMSKMMEQGLDAFGTDLVIATVEQMLGEEANRVAGAPKGKHDGERAGQRHGHAKGYVVMHGRKIFIRRPRVRSFSDGELKLDLYKALQNVDQLELNTLDLIMSGVSTRKFIRVANAYDPIPSDIKDYSTSRSTISRRFSSTASKIAEEMTSRPLGDTRYLVIYIDGLERGGRHALVALGLTEDGSKETLGIGEGTTENATVVRELLEGMLARGLRIDQGVLVVIDGSKALASAVHEVFGQKALVQRCQIHKRRNVLQKLPEHKQARVEGKMVKAYHAGSYSHGKAMLEALADRLQSEGYAQAARSLREGLSETLTCVKLNVGSDLIGTLTNTNLIESAFSIHESCAGRVKRWRHGKQLVNWVAVTLSEAEKSFQPVDAKEALGQLGRALENHVARIGEIEMDPGRVA